MAKRFRLTLILDGETQAVFDHCVYASINYDGVSVRFSGDNDTSDKLQFIPHKYFNDLKIDFYKGK